MTKYIFVTGGVVSSIGKGIVAASLGRLLKNRGLTVNTQKLDPYLNVDPGTMSPYQHGEVFVTDDGAETDLDLGHYERFIDINLNEYSSVSAGKIYSEVLDRERRGDYGGATVQVIPHVTNAIKEKILNAGKSTNADIVITEVGGTVGDIEAQPFIEALRQMRGDVGNENVLYIHTTLVPYLKTSSELKTKPTQHSVSELRSYGIVPNILVTRTEEPLPEDTRDKLALFCDVDKSAVIESRDVETLYTIPLSLREQGMDQLVLDHFGIDLPPADMRDWEKLEQTVLHLEKTVKIAVVGKYVELPDAYLSVNEALQHAGYPHSTAVEIVWVKSEHLNRDDLEAELEGVDGIIVPAGFGARGIEGKLLAIEYARTHKIPYLGITLGLQLAAVEYARNVLGLKKAHTTEVDEITPDPVVDLISNQPEYGGGSGSMRLGLSKIKLIEGTFAEQIYGAEAHNGMVQERHRHRYELNNKYRKPLEEAGLIISAISEQGDFVEMIELPTDQHPFFVATQSHPEFRSRPNHAHPIFDRFIQAALDYKNQ